MLPTQLLNRMSSFRSSLRCTSSRDASRAKGVGGRVVAVGCFGLPYDGLGPHLRPIPTSPNGRGSPQKSHPTDPRLDFCGCPGRSAWWDGVRGVQAGFPCWGFPITPLSQRHGRPTRSPHIDTGHMCHRWPRTTRRIGHEHFARWPETTRRIGHAHSARWPGNTRRIRHAHFVKWAGTTRRIGHAHFASWRGGHPSCLTCTFRQVGGD